MSAEPQSPNLEELPKMPSELQTEVALRAGLKHVPVVEKNVLPTKEDLEIERQHENLKQGIEHFQKSNLHNVNTEEKVVLPTPTDIALEKAPQMAAEFDHVNLKHVEPNVKNTVEGRFVSSKDCRKILLRWYDLCLESPGRLSEYRSQIIEILHQEYTNIHQIGFSIPELNALIQALDDREQGDSD